ncbi:MAG TPA: DUF2460 domain-containing protein [Candidatus Angelobacter sp.]|nr:DUF2460 domain-containing protein [Candidatus Angelobacter sp.]
MPDLLFPKLSPAWGIKRTMAMSTQVSRAPSGRRVAVQFQQYPRWNFQLQLLSLSSDGVVHSPNIYDDFNSLLGLMLQAGGRAKTFLFSARDYNSVAGQALTILTDDSGNKFSPVRYSIGPFTDMVTDLNGAIVVRDNGVVKTLGTDFILQTGVTSSTFSEPGLIIAWQSGHNPTGPVTADFAFYYRCAFTSESVNDSTPPSFENWIQNYWKVPLEFESEFDNA